MSKHSVFSFSSTTMFLWLVLAVFVGVKGFTGMYAQQIKPIRDVVCRGNATKDQLTSLVKCFSDYKFSLNRSNKTNAFVQNCLFESENDISFPVDKVHQEYIYTKCSKMLAYCMRRQMRRYRRPRPMIPTAAPNDSNTTIANGPVGGQLTRPPTGDKRDALIKCEMQVLNLT